MMYLLLRSVDVQTMNRTNLVICSKIVDLLPVQSHPEIFTDELHEIKLIFEPRTVTRYPNSK